MPTVSPAQHRLMEAAAHTPGGYDGVSQAVGKEFVAKDGSEPDVAAAKPAFREPPTEATDHEVAQGIRDLQYPSPQKFGDFWLFDLRITGTGAAWRESLGEWAFRDPEDWLSEEFVARCAGLPVIFEHPDGKGLDAKEFSQRAIGTIVLPYVKGDEVWGIAKIFDADAAELMQHSYRSTSPGVTPPAGSQSIPLESGAQVLAEGLPRILDHLAICQAGVWDKNGQPSGVRLDALIQKGEVVDEKSERELELEKKLDAAHKERDDAMAKLDALDKKRHDAEEEKREEREDGKRKDASAAEEAKEEEKRAGADNDRKDGKRKDARKKHHDAKKHDGEFMDCAKCDSELEEFERVDAAGEETVEAGRGTEDVERTLKDSNTKIASMERQIAELQRANRPLTLEERDELSKSYHRYDSLFQMLMDASPQPTPGETPIAFRKRAANALRKYTTSFKNYVFHDSQQVVDFELVEKAIIDEATAHAKNPPGDAMVGVVRAIKDSTTMPGKVITRFVGDQHAVWAPFTSPTKRFLKQVRTRPHGAAY